MFKEEGEGEKKKKGNQKGNSDQIRKMDPDMGTT
jgi:hypothetical protein